MAHTVLFSSLLFIMIMDMLGYVGDAADVTRIYACICTYKWHTQRKSVEMTVSSLSKLNETCYLNAFIAKNIELALFKGSIYSPPFRFLSLTRTTRPEHLKEQNYVKCISLRWNDIYESDLRTIGSEMST